MSTIDVFKRGAADKINPKIARLNEIWCTEVHCPEILPFDNNSFQEINSLLQRQQDVVESMNADKDPDIVFRSTLYLMDIERVRFSLSRYLRTRLRKVETQLDAIVSNPELVERLSDREREFAFELHGLNGRYMADCVFDRLSTQQAIQDSDDLIRHSHADMQEYVFCSSHEAIFGINVGDNRTKDMYAEEIHIFPYSSVRNHVLRDKIQLK